MDSVILFDRKGAIIDYNLNAQKLLETENLMGERLVNYMQIPKEELERRREDLFKDKKVENFECTLLVNGKEKKVVILSTVIFDEGKQIVGTQDIIRELEVDKVLQSVVDRYKEKSRSFLSYFPGVIYRSKSNEKKELLYISSYIKTITGYSQEDFEEKRISFGDLIYKEDRWCVFKEIKECIEQKRIFDFQYRLIRKDQKVIWIRERGQGVYTKDGKLKYVTGAIFDATHYMLVQKELKKKEHLFKLIFDKANIGVVLVDINRDISKINGTFAEMVGYSEEELVTKNVADITYTYGENERVFKDGSTTTEKQYKRKDGSVFWARVNIVEVADNETNIYYIAFVEDIDEKKRNEVELRQKLKLEELAMKISYDLINESVIDVREVVRKSMYKIGNSLNLDYISLFFTLDKDPIKNRILWTRDESFLAKDEKLIERISKKEGFRDKLFEKKCIIIDDINEYKNKVEVEELKTLNVKSLAVIPLFKGSEFLGAVVFATMVEKYEWSKNCINFFKMISDRLVLTLSKSHFEKHRNELLRKLEDKNQELSDFAKVVSHDLKAPLRGINALINWVKEDNYNELNGEGKANIDLVLERVQKMENLIQGILDFSSLDIKKENSQKADIDKIINDIIHFINIPKNIKVIKEMHLPIIKADEYRMKQVFMNLISNAIKFSDKEEGIIRIGASEKENDWEFYVKDNGKGIEEKYFEKVFKIFETLNDRNSASGVGLSIVKKIIEKYGGKISVESKTGEGTTFIFTIKRNKYKP